MEGSSLCRANCTYHSCSVPAPPPSFGCCEADCKLQGVEQEYPVLRDQGKLAAPGETSDLKRSVGGRKLAQPSELYLPLLQCFSPTPKFGCCEMFQCSD